MKKLYIYILIVFMPILIGVAITNYVLDPGEVYSTRYVDKILEGHKKNLNVTNTPKNINDRAYKKRLCELYKGKSFDYVILGNSRLLAISSEMLPNSSILNLWVSSCKLEDYISFYEILKENNIKYKNVIICADPPNLFNDNYLDSQWMALEDYYYRFFNKKSEMHIDFSRFENLFSLSYFQTALKTESPKEMKFVTTRFNNGITLRTDGSKSYALDRRETSVEKVDHLAKTKTPSMFIDFNELSQNRLDIFDSLIKVFKNEGTNVLFLCCPFHPIFYKRMENLQGLQNGIKYIEDYAANNHIPMIGHFNKGEVSNNDFYDHLHPKYEFMERLFKEYLKTN